jgi:NADP-dependent 3-hydroxy acid dehydrogenase YdfG
MTEGIKDKIVVITGASRPRRSRRASPRPRGSQARPGRAVASKGFRRSRKNCHRGRTRPCRPMSRITNRSASSLDHAVKSHGRIDVIINGLMPFSPLERAKVEDWNRIIDVNIKGVLYGIGAALPHMKARNSGHIINVSSVAGHRVRPGTAVYSATKHAVPVISEGLRQEVKPYNIRSTVISPGAVATELPNSITEPDLAASVRELYERVAISADSFANMVAFAMSQPDDVDINEILFRPTKQDSEQVSCVKRLKGRLSWGRTSR